LRFPKKQSDKAISWLPPKKQPLAWRAGPTRLWAPREKQGRKGEKTVTDEIQTRLTASEAMGAVPCGQLADTGGARDGAERTTPEVNRYLYENLVSNVESQIEHWTRKAVRQPNSETAQTLRAKAEGLGYALRLLSAFEPEFRELTDAAIRPALRDDRRA
jgi:hypothetical protein